MVLVQYSLFGPLGLFQSELVQFGLFSLLWSILAHCSPMGLFLVNLIHLGPLSPISVYFGPFGLFLSNLIHFSFFRSNLVHFDPLWSIRSILVQFDPFRSSLVHFCPLRFTGFILVHFGPFWSNSVLCSNLVPLAYLKMGKDKFGLRAYKKLKWLKNQKRVWFSVFIVKQASGQMYR